MAKKTQFNPHILDNVKTIVANLVDNPGGIKEMGNKKLEPGLVKEILPFEDTVLRIIYYCYNNDLPCTYDDVVEHLKTTGEFDTEDIEARMKTLMMYRTAPPMVKSAAFTISDFIEVQGLGTVLDKWKRNLNAYSYIDVFRGLFSDLKKLAPGSTRFESASDTEVVQQFRDKMEARAAIAESGKLPGPRLPWKASHKALEFAMPGQVNTLVLVSGGGKTAITCQSVFNIAYEQGYAVLFFHLENEAMEMQQRHMVREAHIPSTVFKNGAYYRAGEGRKFTNSKNEEWVNVLDNYDEHLKEKAGFIKYVHAPGITVDELEVSIEDFKIEADKLGLEVVVWIDYFQLLGGRSNYDNQTTKNNENAELLKDMIDNQKVFCFVMAQDATHPDYLNPSKQDTADEVKPYEGYRIYQRSQVLFQLRRKRPQKDLSRLDYDDEMKDWLGNTMYWHRAEDKWDSEVEWFPAKVNDGDTANFRTRMCNAYYEMRDV